MFDRIPNKRVTVAFVLLLTLFCQCSEEDLPPAPMVCTASDDVELTLSQELLPGCTCGEPAESFPVDVRMYGCMTWPCIAKGDTLKIEWVRPNGTIRATHEVTREVGLNNPKTWASYYSPDVVGTWRVDLFRNRGIALSRTFTVH